MGRKKKKKRKKKKPVYFSADSDEEGMGVLSGLGLVLFDLRREMVAPQP